MVKFHKIPTNHLYAIKVFEKRIAISSICCPMMLVIGRKIAENCSYKVRNLRVSTHTLPFHFYFTSHQNAKTLED